MKVLNRVIGKCLHGLIQATSSILPKRGQVLMLHWVSNEVLDKYLEPYSITIDEFISLLNWLRKQNTIRLEEWADAKNFYALTIDDVSESIYLNAFPLLKEYAIPFTLFVNTSLLGTRGYINKEQLLEMSLCDLCTVGSHGVRHEQFRYLSKAIAVEDLSVSKRYLEEIIGKPITVYAFPYGSYFACGYRNKYLATTVYKYAFGTIPCSITTPTLLNKYFLPRINVDSRFIKSIQ